MDWSKYDALWNAPAIAGRIDADIERYRKADASVRVTNAAGKPAVGAKLQIEQISSDFLFGANIFMLGGYPTAQLNEQYEQMFLRLFNAATIPLYWRDLEPEPGNLRFAADSRPIARRPPPDLTVAFCEKHGLNINGHPLVWDFARWSAPDWLPDDPQQAAKLWERRIAQIAERYGGRINRWDVVNEVGCSADRVKNGLSKPMPEQYERLAFQWAMKYLPDAAHLMINEVTGAWAGPFGQQYRRRIEQLIADGAKVDGMGLQFHIFGNDAMQDVADGKQFTPAPLFEALDAMNEFKRPIHISEITLPAMANDEAGRQMQAKIARNFYRLWFSHPLVHAITWWNLPDGGAAPGEDVLASGLVHRDMQPKASYLALEQLIRTDWRTNITVKTDANGDARFRGFCGKYRAKCGEITNDLHVQSKVGGRTEMTVQE